MTNYYLDTHPSKNGECSIRVSIRANGTRFMTSIGFSISPEAWDSDRKLAKPGRSNAKGIPAETINARITAITAAFSQLEATPGALTTEALDSALCKIIGKASKATGPDLTSTPEALYFFDLFTREQSKLKQWTDGTLKCMHACRLNIQYFKPAPTFADFDESGLEDFVSYLRAGGFNSVDNCPEAHEIPGGLTEKTAEKHFKQLKWYLDWAIRKGFCKETAIQRFDYKFIKVKQPVIFLTWAELMKLYKYEIPANGTKVKLIDSQGQEYEKIVEDAGALAKTRDLFCFCAFTSLRYSDMAALKPQQIVNDSIYLTTQKTHDRIEIPLNNFSREILSKYAGYIDSKGRALPVISNQKMNVYLKDLCELCGFNELISKTFYRNGQRIDETMPKWALIGTHSARRSFVCNALAKGMSAEKVMSFTGHCDYESMKPYIAVAKTDARKAMDLFNE